MNAINQDVRTRIHKCMTLMKTTVDEGTAKLLCAQSVLGSRGIGFYSRKATSRRSSSRRNRRSTTRRNRA
jgi:hypothetical protein